MNSRPTHTFANLVISQSAYGEIKDKLKKASYDHLLHDDSFMIDMSGIALMPKSPDTPPETLMIHTLVDAFLAWPLPASVSCDRCVVAPNYPNRVGTNLLTATEARQMFEYVLAKAYVPEVQDAAPPSHQITDPARLAELREVNGYTGQPGRCDACGADKRAPGLGCVICGKPDDQVTRPNFRKDIESALNRYSMENGSNTPDFILAQYLADCLSAYDKAVTSREKWYGREPKPVDGPQPPPPMGWINPETVAALSGTPPPMGWITNSTTDPGERCTYPSSRPGSTV